MGTPAELVAADGTVAGYQQHTLWGGTLWRPGGATTPLRFPGQYHDPETGLHYNQQRYYDPVTGSYLTPDPLGLAPAPNPHAYVPNPLVQTDPLGLMSCCAADGAHVPDRALAVRGGLNTPGRFASASGATFDEAGKVYNVSVNSAPGKSIADLAGTIPNKQIGVAEVGSIHAVGGSVQAAPREGNSYHCLVGGCTPEQFSELFTPTIKNPWK